MVRYSLVYRRDSPWFMVGVATPFRAACGVLADVSYLLMASVDEQNDFFL